MKLRSVLALAAVALVFAAVPVFAQMVPTQPPSVEAAPSATSMLPPGAPAEGFSSLAERLLPAVVNVSNTQTVKEKEGMRELPDFPQFPPGSPFEDFFKDFMEKNKSPDGTPLPKQRKTTSLGSGFIIAADGLIVTNNHVIQNADEITVILHDDTNLKAEIVGRDPKTDLALLKIHADKPLPFVTFGDSDKVKVGDWTVVIGNPFGLGGTVTAGIISARARDINSGPYDDYLQTDASINRGNSGGPMFNLRGEVIGVCTAIFSPSGGSVGIGFAIPSSLVNTVVAELKTGGKIHRGWLGVRIQNVTEEIAKSLNLEKAQGALVSSLPKDSPAAKGGVEAGDVIIGFNGKPVTEMRRLPRMVAEAGVRHNVVLTVWRNGKKMDINVTLGEMKEEDDQVADGEDNGGDQETTTKAGPTTGISELGVKVAPITPESRKLFDLPEGSKGLVIADIAEDSPMLDKGVRRGDVIVEAAQKEMKDAKELAKLTKDALDNKKPLLLLIDRQGDLRFIAVNPEAPKAKVDKQGKPDKPLKK